MKAKAAAPEVREGDVAPYLAKPPQRRHSREGGNPVSVEHLTLDNVLTVIRGVNYKKETARNESALGLIPVLRATNIQDGALNFDDLVYVPESNVSAEQLLRAGDIVIAASSGSRSVVGKAAPLMREWCGSFGAFCFGLRPKPGTDPRFIAWFMQTSEYRNRVSELAAGVNINNLRTKHIEETPFRRPPLAEQRRIVAELETQLTRLDASVAALKRAQANLKRYRASVLKAACEGWLVPNKLTGAAIGTKGELPQGWKLTTVGQVTVNFDGKRIPLKAADREKRPGLFPYYGASGVIDDIDDYLFDGDFLLIAEDGANLLSRSTPIAFRARGQFWVNNHAHVVQTKDGALQPFLAIVLNAMDLAPFVTGSAQPKLTQAMLNRIPIPLPPISEQSRIVAEVERRLSVIEELEATVTANLKRAERLRQSVLSRAFSG